MIERTQHTNMHKDKLQFMTKYVIYQDYDSVSNNTRIIRKIQWVLTIAK